MEAHDKVVLIYATYPDTETAKVGGRALVEARLAACVNILPGMISIYRWEGAVEQGTECVMIIKTRSQLADAVITAAKRQHPYTTPAFLVLAVENGAPDYLAWIAASTADGTG